MRKFSSRTWYLVFCVIVYVSVSEASACRPMCGTAHRRKMCLCWASWIRALARLVQSMVLSNPLFPTLFAFTPQRNDMAIKNMLS